MLPLRRSSSRSGPYAGKRTRPGSRRSAASAILIAILAFRGAARPRPALGLREGAVFGLFPITWIVLTAIWLHRVTVVSGRFEDLRATFDLILRRSARPAGDPHRVLLRRAHGALARFGAPLAITGVMLMAVRILGASGGDDRPARQPPPVAFGAIAILIITAGNLTGHRLPDIGAYVGRQTTDPRRVVPLLLVFLADGRRGLRQTVVASSSSASAFGIAQFVSSNFISVELTDIIASLVGLAAGVLMLRCGPRSDATRR